MFHACIRDFERLSPSPGRRRCNLPRERAQFRGIEGGVGVKYVHVRGAWKVMQATSAGSTAAASVSRFLVLCYFLILENSPAAVNRAALG